MDIDVDNKLIVQEELFTIKTRLFSHCFRAYQVSEFNNLGLILKLVNNSLWFGMGSLHMNTNKSLFLQIKLIKNNFTR